MNKKVIVTFDPYENEFPLEKNEVVYLLEDVVYGPAEDFEEIPSYFKVEEVSQLVIVPMGTKMTFLGTPINIWPSFSIQGDIWEFAGDPFRVFRKSLAED